MKPIITANDTTIEIKIFLVRVLDTRTTNI